MNKNPLYDRLEGRDGFVSLEVSPKLAHDNTGTPAEARRLWKAVNRPNHFIIKNSVNRRTRWIIKERTPQKVKDVLGTA